MPGNDRTLLTQAQMAAGVQALAKDIREANPDAASIALVGIFTRGVPLAKRIAAEIEKLGGLKVFVGTIDITQYRDDLNTFQMVPKRVQLAVLVDRCGREFPVQPDFSALKVTLAPGERVAVRFEEVDGQDACTVQTQTSTR
jgi:pyrimidine operon attenuation protein/uracil phosphoribosyltransferase